MSPSSYSTSMSTPTSTSSSPNTYPFKDTLFSFISSLNLCVDSCNLIKKTRSGASTSSSLSSLKRYLASYAAALSDEYNYHHTGRIGSRIETGDSTAIFDTEKCTSQLRTYVLAPLHEVAVRRTGSYKPDVGFGSLKERAVEICDDVLRIIGYLADRLERTSSSRSPPPPPLSSSPRPSSHSSFSHPSSHSSSSRKDKKHSSSSREFEFERDSSYLSSSHLPPPPSPSPPYIPPYDRYYEASPPSAPRRPVYVPESSYYGVRPPSLYAPPHQPQYVAVRDPYGGVVLVRARR